MPIWLVFLAAPFYIVAGVAVVVVVVVAQVVKYGVMLGQSVVQAVREERAAKRAHVA